jgi:TRAP-type C4-dicarboxylate transport system permease small subunit
MSADALSPGQAVWRGAVTALVVALPAGVLNQFLVDSDTVQSDSPAVLFFWALILFGAAAGGYGVVRLCPEAALWHAAASGVAAYAIVQAIGVVSRTVRGDPLYWWAYPFLALMMATAAMMGGMFARRWNRQTGNLGQGPDGGGTGRQR